MGISTAEGSVRENRLLASKYEAVEFYENDFGGSEAVPTITPGDSTSVTLAVFRGSEFAAAKIAGLAAYFMYRRPDLTRDEIIRLLRQYSKDGVPGRSVFIALDPVVQANLGKGVTCLTISFLIGAAILLGLYRRIARGVIVCVGLFFVVGLIGLIGRSPKEIINDENAAKFSVIYAGCFFMVAGIVAHYLCRSMSLTVRNLRAYMRNGSTVRVTYVAQGDVASVVGKVDSVRDSRYAVIGGREISIKRMMSVRLA